MQHMDPECNICRSEERNEISGDKNTAHSDVMWIYSLWVTLVSSHLCVHTLVPRFSLFTFLMAKKIKKTDKAKLWISLWERRSRNEKSKRRCVKDNICSIFDSFLESTWDKLLQAEQLLFHSPARQRLLPGAWAHGNFWINSQNSVMRDLAPDLLILTRWTNVLHRVDLLQISGVFTQIN